MPGARFLLALAACCITCQLVHAQSAGAEWSAFTKANVLFTDNVFEFSAARRLALAEDPSQPAFVPLNNPSDVVWEPSIDLRHTSRPTHLGLTEVSVKAEGLIYTENPIFNHGNYRIQAKQWLGQDTSVLVRYRYVPNMFLGPNTERRTGLSLPVEERVTSHIWRTEIERRLHESFTATIVGRYGLRFFNGSLSERDTTFWTLGPQLEWKIHQRIAVTASYLYERGLSDGREQIQLKDDVSYQQNFVSLGVTIEIMPRLSCTAGYAYRRKEFTSELAGDSNRGVVDISHQGTIDLLYRLSPAAAVTAGFQRTQRSSNAATRDFFNNNASLGVQYQF